MISRGQFPRIVAFKTLRRSHTKEAKKPVVKRGFIVSASNEDEDETEALDPLCCEWSCEVLVKPSSPQDLQASPYSH